MHQLAFKWLEGIVGAVPDADTLSNQSCTGIIMELNNQEKKKVLNTAIVRCPLLDWYGKELSAQSIKKWKHPLKASILTQSPLTSNC